MGGLARRASYIRKKAAEGLPVLVVDAGGFAHRGARSKLKTSFLLEAYHRIGYQAVNLSEADLRLGPEFLRKAAADWNVPFVTCNLRRANGEPLDFAKPYRIVRPWGPEGPAVGIFGVSIVSLPVFGLAPPQWWTKDDPVAASKSVVLELKDKCDLIVALVYATDSQAQQFLRQVPGVDLVVAGRSTYRIRGPWKSQWGILCVVGTQGKYIGEAVLRRTDSGEWEMAGGELRALDKQVGEDPEIKKLVQEYKNALKQAVKQTPAPVGR